MCVATLVFSGRAWLWPVAVFLVVALLALILAYSRAPAGGPIRAACLLLKVLGLGVLARAVLAQLGSLGFPCAAWSRTQHDVEGVDCYAGASALPA